VNSLTDILNERESRLARNISLGSTVLIASGAGAAAYLTNTYDSKTLAGAAIVMGIGAAYSLAKTLAAYSKHRVDLEHAQQWSAFGIAQDCPTALLR
jgi:hypothetical protein